MLDFNFIKNQFISKHNVIDNEEYLNKYINFLLSYNEKINENDYTEKHHILPVCFFPEYKNEIWNIIKIKYDDHKNVHLWLFKAINIRAYYRTLNWMVKDYKNSKELSLASKRGWIKLKENIEKFNEFKLKRSNHMKTLSSKEQSRRANIFWKNITDKKYIEFCDKMKNYWTDEKKIEKSIQMNEYYSNPNNIIKKQKETQERWNLMSNDDRLKFKEKMNIINKDKLKKQKAGNKIKELWNDPIYLEKMKNRKNRSGIKHKIILSNNEELIFNTMTELEKYFSFSCHLIRKYRDKDIKILLTDLNSNNIILENAIIKTIK